MTLQGLWHRATRRVLLLQRLQASTHLHPAAKEGAAHTAYVNKLRSGVRVLARSGTGLSHLLAEQRIEASMAAGANDASVITQVGSAADVDVVEKWRQGDASLYTAENLRHRRLLRHDPTVVAALQNFWEAALRSVQSDGDATVSTLHKHGYAMMMDRVFRALMQTFDGDDAAQSIEADWAKDTRGAEAMSRVAFLDVCASAPLPPRARRAPTPLPSVCRNCVSDMRTRVALDAVPEI